MAQNNLLTKPEIFQYLYENHPDGICMVDVEGHFLCVNASALAMFGYSHEEILEKSLNQLLNGSSLHSRKSSGEVKKRSKIAIQHKRGYAVYVKMMRIPIISDGQEIGTFITFENITQQEEQSKEIFDIQEMFSLISEKSQNIISSISADGIFTYISPTVEALLGYTPDEVIGKPGAAFNHPDDNGKLHEFRNSLFIDQNTVRFIGRVRHKNGEFRWYETTAEYIRDQSGEIIQTIGVGRDITERKKAEESIEHLAYHDSLTDLPNRRSFMSRVSHLLEQNQHKLHGLMLLDLDGFKYVNDTFGHEFGDLLLIEVAKRLTYAIGDKGIVARWGGDEFTIFQTNVENKAALFSLIRRIEDVISEPMMIAGNTLHISASIGYSFSPGDGDSVRSLIRSADSAMYQAKKSRKEQVSFRKGSEPG